MRSRFLLCFLLVAIAGRAADTVAVLPLSNLNETKSANLDWIGESVAENIRELLSPAGLLGLAREDREEIYRRLAVKPGAVLTKASIIKIGQSLDAGTVVFGEFHVDGAEYGATNPKSNMRISVHMIDLRKLRETPSFEQSGPLENLSQMQIRLAYMVLKQLNAAGGMDEQTFLHEHAAVRVEAMENYVRGLMAGTPDQRLKLFTQAAKLDEKFSQAAFQIGRILFQKKDYKAAAPWLVKVTKADSHYMEASFLLGLCRYQEGAFDAAEQQFRMVAAELPLNEVYNNLGAALSRRNDAQALETFAKALEGDQADPDYWFNVGYSLWKRGEFAKAAEKFRAVLDRARDDQEATVMLGRCIKMDGPRQGDPRSDGRERLKTVFEDSAFRQLQAELKRNSKN